MALQSALRLILLLLTCTAIQGEIPFQVLNKLLDVKNPADLFQLFNVSTDSIGPEMSGPSADFIPDSVLRGDSFPTIAAKDKPIRGRLGGLGGDQGIVLLDDSALGRNPFLSEKVTVSRQGADVVTSLLSEIDFCSPRGMEVKVPNERPSTIVVPSCVNLQRCGGCCHADIFQCEPLETKNTTITVMKLGLAEGGDLVLEVIEGIEMEEHVSCQCGCKVKPHHCNPTIHKYEDCACSCLWPRRDCEEGKARCGMKRNVGVCAGQEKLTVVRGTTGAQTGVNVSVLTGPVLLEELNWISTHASARGTPVEGYRTAEHHVNAGVHQVLS
ncbi:uncharacterized protein LOC144917950 isoform X2 [Branchiostoma floridae x Branchiostoma belcheri]